MMRARKNPGPYPLTLNMLSSQAPPAGYPVWTPPAPQQQAAMCEPPAALPAVPPPAAALPPPAPITDAAVLDAAALGGSGPAAFQGQLQQVLQELQQQLAPAPAATPPAAAPAPATASPAGAFDLLLAASAPLAAAGLLPGQLGVFGAALPELPQQQVWRQGWAWGERAACWHAPLPC